MRRFALFTLFAALLLGLPALGAPTYTAVILGHPGGSTAAEATGVAGGWQVGSGSFTVHAMPTSHALVWSGSADSVVDLNGAFMGSSATGISSGQVVGVGFGSSTGGANHALLWSGPGHIMSDLNPSSCGFSQANAISGNQIVGSADGSALLWSGPTHTITVLDSAFDVSEALAVWGDQVVGHGFNSSGPYHALLWSSPTHSLADLGSGYGTSEALGVWGDEVVGSGDARALIWSGPTHTVLDIGGDLASSEALAISGDQIVGDGASWVGGGARHALLWSGPTHTLLDLSTYLPSGYSNSWACGIDSAGNIVGYADHDAVLWEPVAVPVPGAVWLGALGLSVTGWRLRRNGT